ncbi:MAG TPA: outer membrane protein transport protein [Polyangiaceae bacterium]
MRRAPTVALVSGLSVLLVPALLLASPAASSGFGPRTRSLGGAGTAVVNDAAAVFENPSALTLAEGTGLSFGFSSNGYSFEENGNEASIETVNAFEFGLVVPGAIHDLPVAFGFALSLPNGRLSRVRSVAASESFWPLPDANSQMVDLGAALAIRPWKPLLLGGGIGYLASLSGGFHITGTAVAVDRFGSEYDSDLHHAVAADLTSSRYALLGVSVVPWERFTLALAYRSAARVDQQIEGGLDGVLRTGPLDIPVAYSFQTSATVSYSPAQVAFGASYRSPELTLLSFELTSQRWSAYPAPYANTSSSLSAELPPGLDIILPPPAVGTDPPPSKLRDRLVPSLGFEQGFEPAAGVGLTGRLGYAFERSPVPEDQDATRFLDLDRHVLSLGAGFELSGHGLPMQKLVLDAFCSLALGVSRTLAAGEEGEQQVSGSALAGGVSLGLVFGSGAR